jgi:hypothetical protein
MDHIWVSRNSVRADFGKLIGQSSSSLSLLSDSPSLLSSPGEVKVILTEVLDMKPQSLQEFRILAAQKDFIV